MSSSPDFSWCLSSNGLNIWAIQFIPSNLSALSTAPPAFWIAGLGVFGKRGHPLTRWAVLGMIIGFAGAALMLIPKGGLRTSSLLAEIGALVALLRVGARHPVLPEHRYCT